MLNICLGLFDIYNYLEQGRGGSGDPDGLGLGNPKRGCRQTEWHFSEDEKSLCAFVCIPFWGSFSFVGVFSLLVS